jgi:guanylate kinase
MVSVFILPPTMAELEQRLRRRAEDAEAVVRTRLAQVAADVTHFAEYDYVLINSDFEESVAHVRQILAAERLRTHRQSGLSEFVNQFRTSA